MSQYKDLYLQQFPDASLSDRESDAGNEIRSSKGGIRRSTRLKKRSGGMDLASLADLDDELDRIPNRKRHKAPADKIDLIRNDEESQNMLLDVLVDSDETWLFCNSCQKWRRTRAGPNIPSPWYCEMNPDKK